MGSKSSPSQEEKVNHLKLYRDVPAVHSDIHAKHINALCTNGLSGRIQEYWNLIEYCGRNGGNYSPN